MLVLVFHRSIMLVAKEVDMLVVKEVGMLVVEEGQEDVDVEGGRGRLV